MLARRALHAIHVTALGLWSGSLLMTAAMAAVTFPTMKSLAPMLPGYAGYTGDHWMIAAGKVANTAFAISDGVQFVCAMLAAGSLLVAAVFAGLNWRRPGVVVRAVIMGSALGVLAYHLLVLSPRMAVNLRQYWLLAEAGKTSDAEAVRAAFTADHPTASTVMATLAGLSLIGLILGALAGADGGPERAEPQPAPAPRLETPALLRQGGGGGAR
ncbi:MAG: hypothetical protein JNK35_04945 [Phycisphaerae bacterium]|nr:hypothetical protein [Phycisphaerae bacterium]